MHALFRLTLAAGLLVGCSPIETGTQTLLAAIAVTPPEIAFGEAAVPLSHEMTLYVSNAGKADLDVDISFEPKLPEIDVLGEHVFLLEPEQTNALIVEFTPKTYIPYATEIVITSNDEETPEIRVPVTGTGVYAPQPAIVLFPEYLDFGTVAPGVPSTEYFEIRNEGDAPLLLGEVLLAGSGAFSLFDDPSGDTVAADSTLPVVVVYSPDADSGDDATLTIPSNDPDDPVVEVLLTGNGGDGFQFPVAVIDCPDGAAPPEYVTLDGSASYDPNGTGISTYFWTLVEKPDGSQASFTSASSALVQLFADTAGTYEVGLSVVSGAGVPSATATCVFEAVPDDALHIELTWDGPSCDLDLHLIRDAGILFDSPDDASWCNDQPSWGAAGSDDDPRLDLDDLAGFGPENINILLPADGQYHAAVHYYGDDYDGTVTATVRVYVYGVLISEEQQLVDEFDVWEVGTVDWPAGTFTLTDTLDTSRLTDCF